MLRRFLPLFFVLVIPVFAVDEDALVRKLVDRYSSAREESNPSVLETLFTENADQLVSSGEWRKGRAALVKGMLESSHSNPGNRTITVEDVTFLRDGVAIANARYEIAGDGSRPARRMWSTFVCVREEADWRIAAIRNMLPAPPSR
jgi:uncharacterized protein (TIGR02246 family)